jgi:hypothetical protein
MTLKNLTIISSIALGLIAAPAADAQRGEGRGARTSGMRTQSPSMSAGSRAQFSSRGGNFSRGSQSHRWGNRGGGDGSWRNRGDGNRWRNRDGGNRWRNRDGNHRWGNHNHWRHRRYYPRYYGGFGYPYGYGYGYGYPYFGASAALYYNGYHPQYQRTSYARGGSVVAEVQQELARAGYYRGAVDGVNGSGTRSAIRAYERANGLRVDGSIDQELLGSMGLG